MRLFVGNIRYTMSARELRDLFSPYDCSDVEIVYDPRTGDSRGFAYVVVADEKAITDLDGQQYDGRKLHVEAARPERSKAEVEFNRRRRPADRALRSVS
jgi:RNA recognition motif-containing protein